MYPPQSDNLQMITEHTSDPAEWPSRLASLAALFAVIVGVIVLNGWALDIPVLKSILPGWFPMKANAALCFILTGVALFLTARPQRSISQLSRPLSYVARLCELLTGLIGALTLGEYSFGWNLGIDQWLFREAAGAVGTSHPGRMAQEAALNFVLLSVALWIIGASRKTRVTVFASVTLGILVATLALSATLSYLTPSLGAYGWFGLSIMALHAAITFSILSIAVIAISWQSDVLRWSLDRPITEAFALCMIALVFFGFTTSRTQFHLKETERQISHSEKVMGSTHDLVLEVLAAQSHTRGYVITGDDRFRANYLAAKADSYAKLELLRKLVANNPHQLPVIDRIEVPAIAILRWFQQVVDARQSGVGADNRDRMVRHGEDLLKNLTDTADQINISHRRHIAQLQLAAADASNNASLILFTGTLTSLLIFLVTIFSLNVVERKRTQAEATLRDINANLEARVEERTRQLVLAKEAAEGNEFRWKFAIEGSGDGLWDWNVPQSTVFFSTRWKEMLGFAEDEIGGSLDEWSKRVHPDDLTRVMDDVQAHLDGTTPFYVNEHRVSCKDGSWKWILDRGLVVSRDSAGKPLRVIGTHTDISERKQADDVRKISEEKYRTLVETTQTGYLILDMEGKVVDANPEYVRLTGHSELRDILGKPVTDWTASYEKEKNSMAIAQCVRAGFIRNLVVDYVDGSGRITPVEINASVTGNGDLRQIISLCRDITERKNAEIERTRLEAQLRESQKMEALGTMAGGVAHDFNNALAMIIGNLELARQDVGPDHPAVVSLDEIGKAGRRARDLVQQILSFGRRQTLERKATSLVLVVVETARLVRATLPAMVSLSVNCEPDAPAVLADATQIKQILLNLCGNAIQAIQDHGSPGKVEIDIRAHVQSGAVASSSLKEGRYACLTVRDTGPGMDEATRSHIFEPFFTTKPVGKGTGLGLAVVHGIVQAHEATVDVESAPGKGSEFHIYFPALDAPVEEVAQPDEGAAQIDGAGKRVLYVDDEEAIIFLMKRLLERQGFRVSGFTDPREAVAAVRANPDRFDLVVTDFNMPGMSGLAVASALREIRADLPVVLASGYITEDLRQKAPAAGVRELIYKPNTVDDLCEAVARYANAQNKESESS